MEREREIVIEATASVYHQHAKAIENIIPVIEKFDGKILNKRLDTTMREAAPKGYYVKWITEYGQFKIELSNMDNRYPTGQFSCGYTRNREMTVWCGTYEECLETTEAGNWRIKAEPVVAALKKAAENAIKRCELLLDSLQNGDEIVAGMAKVCADLITYRKQYDSEVLELLGAYCTIENRSPDRNRLISTF